MEKTQIILTDPIILKFFNENTILSPNHYIKILLEVNNFQPDFSIEQKKQPKIKKEELFSISRDKIQSLYNERHHTINQMYKLNNFAKEINRIISETNENEIDDLINDCLGFEKKIKYTCKYCKEYSVLTKKGIVAHERHCLKVSGDITIEKNKKNSKKIIINKNHDTIIQKKEDVVGKNQFVKIAEKNNGNTIVQSNNPKNKNEENKKNDGNENNKENKEEDDNDEEDNEDEEEDEEEDDEDEEDEENKNKEIK
jgi:hypothetical protein